MAGNRQSTVKHAHFAGVDEDEYKEREENSEKAHEEDKLEFKKKQRRRSSVSKLPKGFAARRASSGSADSACESFSIRLTSVSSVPQVFRMNTCACVLFLVLQYICKLQ